MQNSFNGVGRLARNAEISETRHGHPMARFTLAIERNTKEAPEPDWIPCALFGDRVQRLAAHLTKGTLLSVSGRLESYRNGDGHTRLVVAAASIDFLGRPRGASTPAIDGDLEAEVPDAHAEVLSV